MSNPVIHMSSRGTPALPRGRLAFIVDATGSRGPTWDIAVRVQAGMFREAAPIGALSVQLVFFGGNKCRKTQWVSSGEQLAQSMGKVQCVVGLTQIAPALRHVLAEHAKTPIQAVTYIGDCCEEEIDELAGLADECGSQGIPIFVFQEGRDLKARKLFRLLALRSGGQFFEFNPETAHAVDLLSEQLNTVAKLAVGDASAIAAITHKREE